MGKTLLLVLGFLTVLSKYSYTQTYGNEWINYSQSYYQFKLVNEGIYKIDYAALQSSGVPVGTFSSDQMQLFGRDRQQPILVFDGGDNSFDNGDYFLFYADKNDGWLDSTLYEDPNSIGNPAYNIFNDTIIYFFSWNQNGGNNRYTIESFNDYQNYTPANYVLNKSEISRTDTYNIAYIGNGIQPSQFTPGEGYATWPSNGGDGTNGATVDYYFNTPRVYSGTGAPSSVVHVKTNSNSDAQASDDTLINPDGDNHHLKLTLSSNNIVVTDTTFNGYKQIISSANVHPIYLNSGSTNLKFQIIDDLDAVTDYQSFSYASLYYPMTPNFDGATNAKFYARNSLQSKVYLQLSGLNINSPLFFIIDGNSAKLAFPTLESGVWKVLFSNGNGDQKVIFKDNSQVVSIPSLTPVNGTGTFTDFSQVDFDSSDIIIYHPSLLTASQAYKNYRNQQYNVVFANIEELYLQFGGGIMKHNAAIRRFALKVYNQATHKPLALTLLGKGYSSGLLRNNQTYYNMSLIPCFGNPGSDVCYTANLNGSGYVPLIPTGRVSVTTEQQLTDYLAKLISYELQQAACQGDKDWQKQIIHFIGGNPGYQNTLFASYMNQFASIIEGPNYAGNVTNYQKTTYDPFDPALLAQLYDQLETGVSLINFFGHSSSSGFDISIDEPQNWNNQDKYPVVVGNGCHSGDIFNTDGSFGEQLIRTPNAGAIAYLGSSDTEYDISVYYYCKELYEQFSQANPGQPIGKQIQTAIDSIQSNLFFYSQYLKATVGATNLNGDPLLKLNFYDKPEIELTDASLFFNPTDITLGTDSVEINLVIKNLGASINDTILIEINRDFPQSQYDSTYFIEIPYLNYVDSIKFKIPLQPEIGVGINTITAKVDYPSVYPELCDDELNNVISKQFFMKLDAILPIYPYEFSVVPNDSLSVWASTVNPIGNERTYYFEMDTSFAFNSPEFRKATKQGLGGTYEVKFNEWTDNNGVPKPLVLSEDPNNAMYDSVVYYWRTAIDSNIIVWTTTSFQIIRGKEGWGQDNFYQFTNNNFVNINFDSLGRKRDFVSFSRLLEAYNADNLAGPARYSIDNQNQEGGSLPFNILYMAVIDHKTLLPWMTKHNSQTDQVEGHNLLNWNNECYSWPCRQRQEKYFWYYQDQNGLNSINTALNTLIPDSAFVLIWTSTYADYSEWAAYCPSLFTTFNQFGAQGILSQAPERGFIFFGQKGNPNVAQEVIAANAGESMYMSVNMNGSNYYGEEKSPIIGPSLDWKTLYWKQDPSELNSDDSTRLVIELLNYNQAYAGQIDTLFTLKDSILDLGSLVDAQLYPYIRLKAEYEDQTNVTPAQIDRWHVLYSPVPEAAIDGTSGYSLYPQLDTINEGQEFYFAVDIKNISHIHMDSLLVHYWIEDAQHNKLYIDYPRQDSLLALETLRDTVKINTLGLSGISSLWVEVNPYIDGSTTVTDQPEQYHFNNLLQIPFYVKADDKNPILDVTFNGRHILNGDIIDPKSEILITLKDDNDFLIMDDVSDTTLFSVILTKPNGNQVKIPFMDNQGNTIMQWYPAESMYKKFKIIYPAYFEEDGIYTLTVQGSDRSGNLSGDLEYKISFEVIHESTITYLMNYPNPFSTSTRFVFTLTGSEIPDEFLIQIMTISGKVVRQITEDELGPIYIGRNITEYAWDGTDDFGDPLANGVYLYRVMSQIKGEEIKHRETSGDQYFTKEYGKMYLMR